RGDLSAVADDLPKGTLVENQRRHPRAIREELSNLHAHSWRLIHPGGRGLDCAARKPLRLAARSVQCRKWRVPVNTIATLCASAASITFASFTEPPGWITAVAPASMATSRPSGNGKNASDATTEPLVSGAGSFSSFAASSALRAAMRAASTRLICPAPIPTVARFFAYTMVFDFTCLATRK